MPAGVPTTVVLTGLGSLVVAILSVLFAHGLTVYRDWCRRRGDLASAIVSILDAQERSPDPYRRMPWGELAAFRGFLGRFRRKAYDAAIRRYHLEAGQDNHQQDAVGQMFYRDPSRVSTATRELIRFVHRYRTS